MMENNIQMTSEEKIKKYFKNMIVLKSPRRTKLFSAMNIPTFMRDWIVMRFSDSDGNIDEEQVSEYVKKTIPEKSQWNNYLADMFHDGCSVKMLTKVRIDFDMKTKNALFSLPVFGVPVHKGEAVAEWSVIEKYREYLLSPTEVWGIVRLMCDESNDGKGYVLKLIDFAPFCPYRIDLKYFIRMRQYFTTEEWINLIISAIDYSPDGYADEEEKLSVLKRLLPFVEKRLNLIELAPKETGKSYMFSQLSQYGWLVSGGSMSRAKLFYDISRKTNGLVSKYDYVAFDEIQSIRFTDPLEMGGALKGYLESGSYHVGDYRGTGDAGVMLMGNIPSESMDVNTNMLKDLPEVFHDPALLDRFHGFIEGWKIPKMRENLKASGWALNSEYFSEVLHLLRGESVYRSVVDKLLIIPKDAATRDTEAVKRICTAFMKLLFPNVTDVGDINIDEFEKYCLSPALAMRSIIKKQLGVLDPGEFGGKTIPDIRADRSVISERK